MMASASSGERYCSVCDTSSVKAVEWCVECDEFFCTNCLKHHKAFKLFKQHTTIKTERYEELPEFVKTLSFVCSEHEEQLDSFCSAHNSACCIRCALSTHRECSSVVPLKDLISSAKTSPSLLDLEQNIKDLCSYVEKLKIDKEMNKNEIQNQKTHIRDEILKLRKSINDHLDKVESKLLESLNDKVATSTTHIDNVLQNLNEIDQRVQNISSDLIKLKEHASNLQTFLTLPYLMSLILTEEVAIDKLKSDSKLKCKKISISSKCDQLLTAKSFADIQVEDVEENVTYKKEKEKQAQIVGIIKQRTINNISFKFLKKIRINKEPSSNVVSGCCVIRGTRLLFAEYNKSKFTDRFALTNLDGSLIRCLKDKFFDRKSFYDVTDIDENIFAVCCDGLSCVVEFNPVDTGIILRTILSRGYIFTCFGIAYYRGYIYACCFNGVNKINIETKARELLVKKQFTQFSYICCDDKRVFYTADDDTVYCCDINGRPLWQYADTSLLQLSRGIVVDRNGFVYVTGETSGNVVVLSPDGLTAKELCKLSTPRAMCYDAKEHRILVCDTSDKATWYQIEGHVEVG